MEREKFWEIIGESGMTMGEGFLTALREGKLDPSECERGFIAELAFKIMEDEEASLKRYFSASALREAASEFFPYMGWFLDKILKDEGK